MSKLSKKLNIWAIVAAISFLYLGVNVYFLNPVYNAFLGVGFTYIIKYFFSTIFNLQVIVNLIACLLIAVGIFTKFDKIAVSAGSALLWLSSLIGLITNIVNAITKEYYRLSFGSVISTLAYMFTYLLMFAIVGWLAIADFTKKPTPKFLKIAVFAPAVLLAIILVFAFFSGTSNVISALFSGQAFKWTLYSIIINSMNTFEVLVQLIGFTAVAFKLSEFQFKKSKENTVEISEDMVIENVTAE